jgi:hypothetical protein
LKRMAGTTGLEPAASAVTGQRSNQLNYVPTRQINEMRNRQCSCGFARFAYRAPVAPDCPKERDSCPNRPQTASKFGGCTPCTLLTTLARLAGNTGQPRTKILTASLRIRKGALFRKQFNPKT